MTSLKRIAVARKSGEEHFHCSGKGCGFDLGLFWRWSVSDLVSNATRGRLAEYIVARALGLGAIDVRDEWAAYDLETADGVKIEVKSAAFVQSWHQEDYSKVIFSTRVSRAWDPETNILQGEAKRQADVYIFALLASKDKERIDPLNLDQWKFYVVPTKALNDRTRSQHSITLKSLEALAGSFTRFAELGERVRQAAGR